MDKYVCGQCFDDEFIEEFIIENAASKKCSYCGAESEALIAADVSEVAAFIEEGLRSEYGYAVDCLPWESREGGWQGTTYETSELLHEIELEVVSDDLFNDLTNLIGLDTEWCDYDPYAIAPNEKLMLDWDRFSEQVKHRVRYVFFRLDRQSNGSQAFENAEQPFEVLYRIGDLVRKFRLSKVIASGESFFRARLHRCDRFSTVVDMGPPPKEHARYPNRFSPAGIPMFYGASDEETAIAEVYDCPEKPKRVVSVGRFENMRALRVLDFTNLPSYPVRGQLWVGCGVEVQYLRRLRQGRGSGFNSFIVPYSSLDCETPDKN